MVKNSSRDCDRFDAEFLAGLDVGGSIANHDRPKILVVFQSRPGNCLGDKFAPV